MLHGKGRDGGFQLKRDVSYVRQRSTTVRVYTAMQWAEGAKRGKKFFFPPAIADRSSNGQVFSLLLLLLRIMVEQTFEPPNGETLFTRVS